MGFKLAELALSTGNVSALEPKVLEGVMEAAKKVAIGRQLLTINDRLKKEGGRTLTFPFRSLAGSAGIVGEGVGPAEAKATYYTVTATVTKIGASLIVSQETIEESRIDVVQGDIEEVGYSLADFEDWLIMDALYGASASVNVTTAGVAQTTVHSLGTSLVLKFTPNTGINVVGADYYDGKVIVDTAVTQISGTIKYSTRSRQLECSIVSTTGSVYQALVDARANLALVPRKPDVAILNIAHWANIATDRQFIDVSRYGTNEVLLTGEMGKAANIKCILADRSYPGAILVMQSFINKYLVVRRDLELKKKDYPELDSFGFYFYMEEIPVITNDDSIVLVFGAAKSSQLL